MVRQLDFGSLFTQLERNSFRNRGNIFGKSRPERCRPSNVTVVHGDQSSVEDLSVMIDRATENNIEGFDIFVDDGSHVPMHQKVTFDVMFQMVKPEACISSRRLKHLYKWWGAQRWNILPWAPSNVSTENFMSKPVPLIKIRLRISNL